MDQSEMFPDLPSIPSLPLPVEVTVTLRAEDMTYKQKFLSYDPVMLNVENPIVDAFIKEAKNNFKLEPDDIKIRASCVLK